MEVWQIHKITPIEGYYGVYGTKWQATVALIRDARIFADRHKIQRYKIFEQTPYKEVQKTGYFRYDLQNIEWQVERHDIETEEEKNIRKQEAENLIVDFEWQDIADISPIDSTFYDVELSDGTIIPNLYFSAELGAFLYPNGQSILIEEVIRVQQKEGYY